MGKKITLDAATKQEYVGIEAAATKLAVDPRTIRRMIAANRLPAYRVGTKIIRVRLEDLDAMMEPVVPNDVAG